MSYLVLCGAGLDKAAEILGGLLLHVVLSYFTNNREHAFNRGKRGDCVQQGYLVLELFFNE